MAMAVVNVISIPKINIRFIPFMHVSFCSLSIKDGLCAGSIVVNVLNESSGAWFRSNLIVRFKIKPLCLQGKKSIFLTFPGMDE
jgi:hypothetical protein